MSRTAVVLKLIVLCSHSASNYVDMTSKVILINKPTGVKELL